MFIHLSLSLSLSGCICLSITYHCDVIAWYYICPYMFVHLHRVGNDMVSSSSKKKAESQAVTIKDIEEFAHRTWLITPIALIALIALTRTLSNILRPHYNPNDPRNPHNSGKRR